MFYYLFLPIFTTNSSSPKISKSAAARAYGEQGTTTCDSLYPSGDMKSFQCHVSRQEEAPSLYDIATTPTCKTKIKGGKKGGRRTRKEASPSPTTKDDSSEEISHLFVYISLSVTKAVFVVPATEAKRLSTLPVHVFGSSFTLNVDTEDETINEAKAQDPPVVSPHKAFLSVRLFGGDSEQMIDAMQDKLNQRLARIVELKASMHDSTHRKVIQCV